MATMWERIRAFFRAFSRAGDAKGPDRVDPGEDLDLERERRRGFPGPT